MQACRCSCSLLTCAFILHGVSIVCCTNSRCSVWSCLCPQLQPPLLHPTVHLCLSTYCSLCSKCLSTSSWGTIPSRLCSNHVLLWSAIFLLFRNTLHTLPSLCPWTGKPPYFPLSRSSDTVGSWRESDHVLHQNSSKKGSLDHQETCTLYRIHTGKARHSNLMIGTTGKKRELTIFFLFRFFIKAQKSRQSQEE